MKILALYSTRTLSALRRVIAPFSVLSNRGHSFAFMEVPQFSGSYGIGYDATVLPNWVLSQDEIASIREAIQKGAIFTYDLSDKDLLQQEEVLETLRLCRLVTVPNAYLQKEVKIAVPGMKVEILPSVIDLPYLMTANTYPLMNGPHVACFGPFDWHLVEEAIQRLHDEGSKIRFLGSQHAVGTLKTLVTSVDVTFESYPRLLRQCSFALMPIEVPVRGEDLIWQHEFGIFCKPTICLQGKQATSTDAWITAIKHYAHQADLRAKDGLEAQKKAKEYSAVRIADRYLKVYHDNLRYLAAARYTGGVFTSISLSR